MPNVPPPPAIALGNSPIFQAPVFQAPISQTSISQTYLSQAPISLACIFRLQEKPDTMSLFPETIPTAIRPTPSKPPTGSQTDPQANPPETRGRSTTSTAPGAAVSYKQRMGYYALHYTNATDDVPGAEFVMAKDGGGAIAVFQGEAPSAQSIRRSALDRGDSPQVTPVYTMGDGVAAVPTGQVFLRFAEGVDARDRAANIQAAGYVVVRVLDFAPQGAWVRAESGKIADGLQQLRALEGLENLENIEPQMLMQRSLR